VGMPTFLSALQSHCSRAEISESVAGNQFSFAREMGEVHLAKSERDLDDSLPRVHVET
jgi:hypothetical protein